MAFPTVAATATYGSTANATSHACNLPTGIASGNLLLLVVTTDTDAAQTTPVDWTRRLNTASSTLVRVCGYVKVATGSEGSTVTIDLGAASEGCSSICYRITGWSGDLTGVEQGTAAAANSSTPNPPTVTASWGALDNLFVACCGDKGNGNTVAGYPTNYSGSQTAAASTHADGTGTAMATQNIAAATDDPGTFNITNTARNVAETFVIRPAAAAGGAPPHQKLGLGSRLLTGKAA